MANHARYVTDCMLRTSLLTRLVQKLLEQPAQLDAGRHDRQQIDDV